MTRRSCPLCDDRRHDGLVYHHWCYTTDEGVELCRDCHEYLHADGDSTPMNDARWIEAALERLVDRHIDVHGRPESAGQVIDRYGVPRDTGIMVSMTLNDRYPDRVAPTH